MIQSNRLPGRQFEPKLVSVLRHGYSLRDLHADAVAGLTVAVVALPLAMALAIASGATPDKGIHTAIVAGFLISALGGSKVQIGGPTAAFIPVVFNVIEQFGYDGLILATLMSGLMLMLAGVLRLGNLMKFIPQPVVTGFTAGIAVTIFVSQIKDALGLSIDQVPGEFFARWKSYFAHIDTLNMAALGLTLGCLALLILIKRWRPAWPVLLIVVVIGALVGLVLPVATIGSTFGALPTTLPDLALPQWSATRIVELLPAAFTIAFLAGVESLLSAVVADGMTDGKHRSNAELVAQGVANIGSALIGGLPATGAIARTATSIRAGARSPVAGILHALFLLIFILLGANLMAYVPLPALAAVLLIVAWNMSEIERFRHLLGAARGDRLVLIVTFVLTVVFDLTVAIETGVVLAAFVFMQRMSQAVEVAPDASTEGEGDEADRAGFEQREALPPGVEACRVSGPLFFAAVNRLDDILNQIPRDTRVFIVRMRQVPIIDASGEAALRAVLDRCSRLGIDAIFSGLRAPALRTVNKMGLAQHPALLALASDFPAALEIARSRVGGDAG